MALYSEGEISAGVLCRIGDRAKSIHERIQLCVDWVKLYPDSLANLFGEGDTVIKKQETDSREPLCILEYDIPRNIVHGLGAALLYALGDYATQRVFP